jgi:hypothetical protein
MIERCTRSINLLLVAAERMIIWLTHQCLFGRRVSKWIQLISNGGAGAERKAQRPEKNSLCNCLKTVHDYSSKKPFMLFL